MWLNRNIFNKGIIIFFVLLVFSSYDCLSISAEEIKLTVQSSGLYMVKGSDLEEAGVTLPLNTTDIKIMFQGKEIPFILNDEGSPGLFESGDWFRFYSGGINRKSQYYKYTNNDFYWLVTGKGKGLSMEERIVTPILRPQPPASYIDILHGEKDTSYSYDLPIKEDADHWFWGDKIAENESRKFSFNISKLSTDSKKCKVRVNLQGRTDTKVNPDHHTILFLNNILIDDKYWDGYQSFIQEVNLDNCSLINGENILEVKSVGDTKAEIDRIYFNWFEIEYSHAFTTDNNTMDFNVAAANTWMRIEVGGFTQPEITFLDITDPNKPVKLTEMYSFTTLSPRTTNIAFVDYVQTKNKYYATSLQQIKKPEIEKIGQFPNLNITGIGADYIVITYDDFYNAIQPLIEYRKRQGLRVVVVKISDVYNNFSFGYPDPKAIKDFLSFAFHNWQSPAPKYVLLVGDANVDMKGNFGPNSKNFVPTHFFNTFENRQAPDDNWFVTVEGNDPLPDMAIGRLPVRTSDETDAIVRKIINYEATPLDHWSNNLQFVADDDKLDMVASLKPTIMSPYLSDDESGSFLNPIKKGLNDDNYFYAPIRPDSLEYSFESVSEKLIGILPPSFNPLRVYLRDYPLIDGGDLAKKDIISNFNNGALITTYVGHGSLQHWAAEMMFTSSDVDSLNNSNKLGFVVSLNCLNGYFVSPFEGTEDPVPIAEAFIKASEKGAIGVWASTWLGETVDHEILSKELFKTIFEDGDNIIGSAVTKAKISAFSSLKIREDSIHSFTLFGDPALRLAIDPVIISTTSVPEGKTGEQYSVNIGAKGGTSPYKWDLFKGKLPDGLSLDSVSGIISGVPIEPGSFNLDVIVTDMSSPILKVGKRSYSFQINGDKGKSSTESGGGGGGCFIATAAFGSYMEPMIGVSWLFLGTTIFEKIFLLLTTVVFGSIFGKKW